MRTTMYTVVVVALVAATIRGVPGSVREAVSLLGAFVLGVLIATDDQIGGEA